MTDSGLPTYLHRGLSLSHAELCTQLAAKHLRGVIRKVLADGKVTPDEYEEVHRAVEAVLPFDDRRQAMSARLAVEAADTAARVASGSERRPVVLRIGAVVALTVLLVAVVAWFLA